MVSHRMNYNRSSNFYQNLKKKKKNPAIETWNENKTVEQYKAPGSSQQIKRTQHQYRRNIIPMKTY